MTLISNINLRVLWTNGPDSLHGITQKLKYSIIVTQDKSGVNEQNTIYRNQGGFVPVGKYRMG